MELRSGIGILAVQQIVNAGGNIEVLDQILAEQGEIDHGVSIRLCALHRDGLTAGTRHGGDGITAADISEFQTRKKFVFNHGTLRSSLIMLFGESGMSQERDSFLVY